jgi:hypothetical protein
MATRSVITDKVTNRGIYCHWDGYPSHHAPTLSKYYDTQEKVDALINLGDISVLGKMLEGAEVAGFDEEDNLSIHTIAYHRDMGREWESNKPAQNIFPFVNQFVKHAGAQYIYIWNGTEWKWRQIS